MRPVEHDELTGVQVEDGATHVQKDVPKAGHHKVVLQAGRHVQERLRVEVDHERRGHRDRPPGHGVDVRVRAMNLQMYVGRGAVLVEEQRGVHVDEELVHDVEPGTELGLGTLRYREPAFHKGRKTIRGNGIGCRGKGDENADYEQERRQPTR